MEPTALLSPEARRAVLARLAAFYHLDEDAVLSLALTRLAQETFEAPAHAIARATQAPPAPRAAPQ
jgi:hypothetical protein